MTADPKTVVRAFVEALNRKDWEVLGSLLADDMTYTVMGYDLPGTGTQDKNTMLQTLPSTLGIFDDASPRLKITNIIVDGTWVLAEQQGTGAFRNGTRYENRYANVFEVVGGKVRTVREYMDTQHMAGLIASALPA